MKRSLRKRFDKFWNNPKTLVILPVLLVLVANNCLKAQSLSPDDQANDRFDVYTSSVTHDKNGLTIQFLGNYAKTEKARSATSMQRVYDTKNRFRDKLVMRIRDVDRDQWIFEKTESIRHVFNRYKGKKVEGFENYRIPFAWLTLPKDSYHFEVQLYISRGSQWVPLDTKSPVIHDLKEVKTPDLYLTYVSVTPFNVDPDKTADVGVLNHRYPDLNLRIDYDEQKSLLIKAKNQIKFEETTTGIFIGSEYARSMEFVFHDRDGLFNPNDFLGSKKVYLKQGVATVVPKADYGIVRNVGFEIQRERIQQPKIVFQFNRFAVHNGVSGTWYNVTLTNLNLLSSEKLQCGNEAVFKRLGRKNISKSFTDAENNEWFIPHFQDPEALRFSCKVPVWIDYKLVEKVLPWNVSGDFKPVPNRDAVPDLKNFVNVLPGRGALYTYYRGNLPDGYTNFNDSPGAISWKAQIKSNAMRKGAIVVSKPFPSRKTTHEIRTEIPVNELDAEQILKNGAVNVQFNMQCQARNGTFQFKSLDTTLTIPKEAMKADFLELSKMKFKGLSKELVELDGLTVRFSMRPHVISQSKLYATTSDYHYFLGKGKDYYLVYDSLNADQWLTEKHVYISPAGMEITTLTKMLELRMEVMNAKGKIIDRFRSLISMDKAKQKVKMSRDYDFKQEVSGYFDLLRLKQIQCTVEKR